MVNRMNKFSPNISTPSKPLSELLSTKKSWLLTPSQEEAFQKLKEEISSPRVLAIYNPESKMKISADASAYGIGRVILQSDEDTWKPVGFASRALSDTECRYAKIERKPWHSHGHARSFWATFLVKKSSLKLTTSSWFPYWERKVWIHSPTSSQVST